MHFVRIFIIPDPSVEANTEVGQKQVNDQFLQYTTHKIIIINDRIIITIIP